MNNKSTDKIDIDSKHAKNHSNDIVEEEGYLNLDKKHKDWYNRREMGKQRRKPKYAPKDTKKNKKDWKNK